MLVRLFSFLAIVPIVAGCYRYVDPGQSASEMEMEAVATYSSIVYATYEDAVHTVHDLNVAIHALTTTPSATTLEKARAAWLASREVFDLTDAFRFYGGPIDGLNGPEGMINGWPMDESFVDYTTTNSASGIISDSITYPTITPDLLAALNEAGGETNISCGYHAIEFLLWGQDEREDGPGERSWTDYVSSDHGRGATAIRRAAYITSCVDLLETQLKEVRDKWHPTSGSYRAQFVSTPHASLEALLTGTLKFALDELSGERMAVAMQTADQEDEHSCFSDNTHRDIVRGQQGIVNVLLATYTRLNGEVIRGVSFVDYVNTFHPTISSDIRTALNECSTRCEQLRHPFDAEIRTSEGRSRVKAAIDAIVVEGAHVQDGIFALGLHVVL